MLCPFIRVKIYIRFPILSKKQRLILCIIIVNKRIKASEPSLVVGQSHKLVVNYSFLLFLKYIKKNLDGNFCVCSK